MARKRKRPISPEAFKHARLVAGYSIERAADLLRVTQRTIRNWESGKSRIPYAALKLLRLLSGYELPDPAWAGWSIHSGRLWSPEVKSFQPGDLRYLQTVFEKARQWDRLHKPVVTAPPEPQQLTLDGIEPIWRVQTARNGAEVD